MVPCISSELFVPPALCAEIRTAVLLPRPDGIIRCKKLQELVRNFFNSLETEHGCDENSEEPKGLVYSLVVLAMHGKAPRPLYRERLARVQHPNHLIVHFMQFGQARRVRNQVAAQRPSGVAPFLRYSRRDLSQRRKS